MRHPGHGFPPPGPWPYWDDLAGESISMVDEIHSKLADKRQDMAPFHVGRLRDAGLTSAGRLPPPPSQGISGALPGPRMAPTTGAMSSAAAYESPSEDEARGRWPGRVPQRRWWPPPQLGFDEAGGTPDETGPRSKGQGKGGQMPVAQAQEVIVGRPIGHLGQMDSAAAYESPQEEYHSAGAQTEKDTRPSNRQGWGWRRLWPHRPSRDTGARSSNWTGRTPQPMMTSLQNIGGNLHHAAASTLELADGLVSLGASTVGAAAIAAQGAASVADTTGQMYHAFEGAIGDPLGTLFMIGNGGGDGAQSEPERPPRPLALMDIVRVPRPAALALHDREPDADPEEPPPQPVHPGAPRPKRQPRWMAHVAEGRAWVNRTANGGNVLNPSGTRGWTHRGPVLQLGTYLHRFCLLRQAHRPGPFLLAEAGKDCLTEPGKERFRFRRRWINWVIQHSL